MYLTVPFRDPISGKFFLHKMVQSQDQLCPRFLKIQERWVMKMDHFVGFSSLNQVLHVATTVTVCLANPGCLDFLLDSCLSLYSRGSSWWVQHQPLAEWVQSEMGGVEKLQEWVDKEIPGELVGRGSEIEMGQRQDKQEGLQKKTRKASEIDDGYVK